jgi:DNA-binding transcriptional LysR family regulator
MAGGKQGLAAIDLDQIRAFLAVLEHGSFSRAGESIGVGQSTVSFHVKALETALGAVLVDRKSGAARATAAGKILRRYARRITALCDEAAADLRQEALGESGSLTIAASSIPGGYLLPPVLVAFRRTHPGVALAVEVSDSRRALHALLAQECDLALIGAPVRDRKVVCSAFAEDEIVLVAPGRERRGKVPRLPLILREEGHGVGRLLHQA